MNGMKSFEWLHGKLDSIGDWVVFVTVTILFAVVILILLITPFFDDWDDERGKGE
jgi:hypothetical protein